MVIDVAPVVLRSADAPAGRHKSPRSKPAETGPICAWPAPAPCASPTIPPSRSGSATPDNPPGWPARQNARRNPPAMSRNRNSVTSCSMNLKSWFPARCAMLSTLPVTRLSIATTLWPLLQQVIHQVRPQKARPARDDGDGLRGLALRPLRLTSCPWSSPSARPLAQQAPPGWSARES